jgi:iron complex transport system permease protein
MRPDHLTRGRALAGVGLALLLLLVALALGASLGAGHVPLGRLLGVGRPLGTEERVIALRILWEVRLPRVLLAAVLGGALTVAGIGFQALLRNPLADPYVLGVSGGASLGGVTALLLGVGAAGGMLGTVGVPGAAFLGALAALVLIERVASVGGRFTVHTLLLTGVIFNAFSAALIYFIQSVASLEQLHAIVFYLMGRVPYEYGYPAVAALAVVCLAATGALLGLARDFNALSLGEEGAHQLGVEVERTRRLTYLLGSLLTGIAVALAGLIGFVGLVVPHLLRLLLGPDHRVLIPAGFLGGGAFLVVADLAARTVAIPNELPVGVLTALVGGPFFLLLLRRRGSGYAFG